MVLSTNPDRIRETILLKSANLTRGQNVQKNPVYSTLRLGQ